MAASGVERNCALVACALSEGRRAGARLQSGERRAFGLNPNRTLVHVPYPTLAADWTLRSLTCGVALQCAPSKDRIARHSLDGLPGRLLHALTIVEGAVALGWVESRWPGLLPEFERLLPGMEPIRAELDGAAMLERADALARADRELRWHPLLGRLPLDPIAQRRPAGVLPAHVRPDALVVQAHAVARAPYHSSRRTRRRPEPEYACVEPARRGCNPERSTGGDSVSGVERLDAEIPARSRGSAGT